MGDVFSDASLTRELTDSAIFLCTYAAQDRVEL